MIRRGGAATEGGVVTVVLEKKGRFGEGALHNICGLSGGSGDRERINANVGRQASHCCTLLLLHFCKWATATILSTLPSTR